MKHIMNYIILLIAFVITTYSVKAENVKIYLKNHIRENVSQLKVVLTNNGNEYYADSKGTVVIRDLIAGKRYSIKIKFVSDNKNKLEIKGPKIRPQNKSNPHRDAPLVCDPSGECFTEYSIYL